MKSAEESVERQVSTSSFNCIVGVPGLSSGSLAPSVYRDWALSLAPRLATDGFDGMELARTLFDDRAGLDGAAVENCTERGELML